MPETSPIMQAIELINAGRILEAREMLRAIIAANPMYEAAWIWYAHIADNPAQRVAVLQQYLQMNPNSQEARNRLNSYNALLPQTQPPAAAPVGGTTAAIPAPAASAQTAPIPTSPAPQPESSIAAKLEQARQELLDLGLANPLINYRLLKARGVQVNEPDPAQVFTLLVGGKPLFFAPSSEVEPDILDADDEIGEEGDEEPEADPPVNPTDPSDVETPPQRSLRQRGIALQTPHPEGELEKRLLNTYHAARTFVEEQGVNVLFLVFGLLKWYEDPHSDLEHSAPLVLVPVELSRADIRSRFRIQYTEDDLGENLSLHVKLKTDFGIELPPIPDLDDFDLNRYFRQVEEAVCPLKRWHVDSTAMALGFFSFATLLMYNDLMEENWVGIQDPTQHPIISALLAKGFPAAPSSITPDTFMDDTVDPHASRYVLDADSSQIAALLAINEGRNLVIQGPPGTGKSQTIANVIAEALGQGKRVLFVAEKMAALEVVKRRLDTIGLGEACLELHSQKTSKRAVLAELQRTLSLGRPKVKEHQIDIDLLITYRDRLNAYSHAMNTPIGKGKATPFECYGHLLEVHDALETSTAPQMNFAPMSQWAQEDYRRQRELVAELQALLGKMGQPDRHPFWASHPPSVTPLNRQALLEKCRYASAAVESLRDLTQRLASELGILPIADRAGSTALSLLIQRLITAPGLTGITAQSPAWLSDNARILEAIRAARRLQQLHDQYDSQLTTEAWSHDVATLKDLYVTRGRRIFRIFDATFKQARAEVEGLCQAPPPRKTAQQLALLEAIAEAQHLTRTVAETENLLSDLYGAAWRVERPDWFTLEQVAVWLGALHQDVQSTVAFSGVLGYLGAIDPNFLQQGLTTLQHALETHQAHIAALIQELHLDESTRFGAQGAFLELPYVEQHDLLETWIDNVERWQEIFIYNNLVTRLQEQGLRQLTELTATWPPANEYLVALFDRTWYAGLLELAIQAHPEIAMFDRETHEQCITRFQELDRLQFQYNRARLAELHWSKLPQYSPEGQMGVLWREFEKRRRHLPIRKLMQQAGNAIQALKPVFMMSPLSIATYLPPGSVSFDLVVFDEASQVKPADAFGAILRGRQVVVTGDNKQLPPTLFFERIIGGDDEEDNTGSISDMESILGLFLAQGAPERMLNWHYRSRHESLIAVSNSAFYRNALVVFPSPDNSRKETGLAFHHLPQAFYDRGKSRTNRDEARVVAQAVMQHARNQPDWTLGVAAFSMSQMQAIQNQLEILRKQDPSCESFFSAHPHEPFFIKNLENVQGDERDVIMISVGYGRSADGNLTMNFGPLNREGGERRLNVLITRARYRCEVFSNLVADDIILTPNTPTGVVVLKQYLEYAASGNLNIAVPSQREADSPFEEQVARFLRSQGYQVDHQVGSAGFFIDLAIKDPENPGRYLLGIECDGAAYHSARSARDRDRLRQEVLENLGWQIYRIWSTDWFNRQTYEKQRLLDSIEKAKANHPNPHARNRADVAQVKATVSTSLPQEPQIAAAMSVPSHTEIWREEKSVSAAQLSGEPYRIAPLKLRPLTKPLHEVPPGTIANWVTKVVEIESPIHQSELIQRIVEATRVGHTGSRITQAIMQGVAYAQKDGKVRQRGEFIWLASMSQPPIRDRSNLPLSARKMELVAPEEIAAAAQRVVGASMGMKAEDIPSAVGRMLGFRRTSAAMETQVKAIVQQLVQRGLLVMQGEFLVMPNHS